MSEFHYVLQVRAKQGHVSEQPFVGAMMTVGRHPDNDVVLDDPTVSSHHLRIEPAPPGAAEPFAVVDLGSRSGTMYRGQRLTAYQPVAIQLKKAVMVGPYMLRLAPAAAAAPVAPLPPPAPAMVERQRTWLAPAGFALALLSLLINLVLVLKLGQVSQLGREIATEASGAFDRTRGEGIDFTIDLSQAIPIAVDVPIDETFTVRVQHDLVINEMVQSQVTIPVIDRTVSLDIPIRATIPLDLEVPVHFQETVSFDDEISVDVTVPVHFDPDAMGWGALMEKIEGWLERLQRIF